MKAIESDLTTLDQFKDKHYSKPGTKRRDALEAGYEDFKMGVLIQEAMLDKGLTQQELADKATQK